ncbi:MAG: hypothetical protein LBU06_00860 [Desulfovibrio sp.]|nr:hypothetical protein [Desulfovibrio sp.]
MRFLQRRLLDETPKSLLHKWIRSGQVRVNGRRGAPFALLAAKDLVRLPPFASARKTGQSPRPDAGGDLPVPGALLGPGVRVIGICEDVLVLDKASGVSCHPGGGLRGKTGAGLPRQAQNAPGSKPGDLSVAEVLSLAFAASPYIPAPAHRLDRRSSGLLLAGLSRAAAARLQTLFKNGGIRKYYLAWCAGFVPWEGPLLLEDRLAKRVFGGREIMSAGSEGQRAVCAALALRRREPGSVPVPATLLLLRLLSGRKHQLRAQLAARGFPLIGDGLRGGPDYPVLLLHAHSLGIPARGARTDPSRERPAVCGDPSAQEQGCEFRLPPPWLPDLVPDEREISGAKKILDAHVAACGQLGI